MIGRRNSRGRFIKCNVPWNKRMDSIKDSILESGKLDKGISHMGGLCQGN
jgi:hypothetical protein